MMCTTSPNIDATGGTVSVIYVTCVAQLASIGVTDSSSNTYTLVPVETTSGGALNVSTALYYSVGPTVTASMTASTGSNATIACHAYFAVFKNTLSSMAVDGTPGGAAVNTTAGSVQPGSQTPSATGYLIVTGMGTLCGTGASACSAPVVGIDSGFTLFDSDNALGIVQGGFAYKVGTTAAVNPTWTVGNSTEGMGTHMIIFKHN